MVAKHKRQFPNLLSARFLSLHRSWEEGPHICLVSSLFLRKIFFLTAVLYRHIVLNQEGHFKGKMRPGLARSS